jgi:hypothetical protein
MLFIFLYFLIMILLTFKKYYLLNKCKVDILKANINNSYTPKRKVSMHIQTFESLLLHVLQRENLTFRRNILNSFSGAVHFLDLTSDLSVPHPTDLWDYLRFHCCSWCLLQPSHHLHCGQVSIHPCTFALMEEP